MGESFWIMGIICQSTYPTQPKLHFYDWCKKRQFSNTANGCHSSLNRGEGETDMNSLPHYSLPASILILHLLLFLPLLVDSLSLFIHRR